MTSHQSIADIRKSMHQVFHAYSSLRKQKWEDKIPFWDVVVLTTLDETQRKCYLQQLDHKRENGELPQVPIYVIADPPHQKLGVGGSTVHVLSELFEKYGEELFNMKVQIIHSGGSSQRLPSYSFLGKIFAPMPIEGLRVGEAVPQMVDLKLAMHMPLYHLMGPGLLVSCGDDIGTCCMEPDKLDKDILARADAMALGHPSSPQGGTTHGVYVVKDKDSEMALSDTNTVLECIEVLQKVSVTTMYEKEAVYRRGVKGEGSVEMRDEVWSDSAFWLSSKVCGRLLKWYKHNRPFAGELDAYAHFLPCLGARLYDAKPEDFNDFRSEMLPLFQGIPLMLIALPKSKYFHIGTMREYLVNFNEAQDFISELGLNRDTSNMRGKVCVEYIKNEQQDKLKEPQYNNKTSQGTLIQCHFLSPDVRIQVINSNIHYVIEYCQIGITLRLIGNVIISNCWVTSCPSLPMSKDTVITVPGDTLFHTVPILYQGESLYVTIAFDLDTHMKAQATRLKDIKVFGKSLQDFIEILGLEEKDVRQGHQGEEVSLWNARLFTPAKTAPESFWITHAAVCKVKGEGESVIGMSERIIDNNKNRVWFSMKDLVGLKDLNTMLKERRQLAVGDVTL